MSHSTGENSRMLSEHFRETYQEKETNEITDRLKCITLKQSNRQTLNPNQENNANLVSETTKAVENKRKTIKRNQEKIARKIKETSISHKRRSQIYNPKTE